MQTVNRVSDTKIDVLRFGCKEIGSQAAGIRIARIIAQGYLQALRKVSPRRTYIHVHALVEQVVHVEQLRSRSTILRDDKRIDASEQRGLLPDDASSERGPADLPAFEPELADLAGLTNLFFYPL